MIFSREEDDSMRLNNSIMNFIVKIIPTVLQLFLNFFIIRVYLSGLGDDVYGFYQLCTQTITHLTFIEGSVGIAVSYAYFTAFATLEKERICGLFTGSIKTLNKIAAFIIVFSVGFILCLPIFNKDANIGFFYSASIFILLLIPFLIDYYIVLPYKYVIDADQKGYKVSLYYDVSRLIYMALGIVIVYFTKNLAISLAVNCLLTFIAAQMIKNKVKSEYPWLKRQDNPNYSFIRDMIYILPNKISLVITDSTDVLLITLFLNYTYVTKYSNYNYIALTLTSMISILVYSSFSSLGNFLLKETDINRKRNLFYQLNGFLYFLAMFVSTTYFLAVKNFISNWLGESYILPDFTVGLFALLLFVKISRWAVILTSNAAGLYKETYMTYVIQSILNIVLSLLLVKQFEINGLLIATILATGWFSFVITKIVFKEVYKMKSSTYSIGFAVIILVFIGYIFGLYQLNEVFGIYTSGNLIGWTLTTVIFAILNGSILFTIFIIFHKQFREFMMVLYHHMMKILKGRK